MRSALVPSAMLRIALLVGLAACAQNQAEKDLYDDIEAGSHWQLSFNSGAHSPTDVGGGHASGAYAGPCPALTPKLVAIPTDVITGAESGCQASLGFGLSDDGDVTPVYNLSASFVQTCADTSDLQCSGDHFASGDTMICWWRSGTIDPAIDGLAGDCTYSGELVRVD